ncbi:MAG: sensor histidine kinase [Terriglobia bacterium]
MGTTAVAFRRASFGAPHTLTEMQHRERVLAGARTVAALCSLAALHFDPSLAGRYTLTAHLLLFLYLVHSFATLGLLHYYPDYGPGFLLAVHGADVLWPALITLYTNGPNSPFSALFTIALVGAAYRWGLRETLGTALASMLLFLCETAFVTSGWGRQFDLLRGEFRFSAFSIEMLGILILGSLLGHLAGREQKLRGESLAIRRIVETAGFEAGIDDTVEEILCSIRELFDADRVTLALSNRAMTGGLLWKVGKAVEDQRPSHFAELSAEETARYFSPAPAESWRLRKAKGGEGYQLLIVDADGRHSEKVVSPLPGNLVSELPFHTLLATAFTIGNEWAGRVFLFDSRNPSRLPGEARFLQELVKEAAPAIHRAYVLRRSWSRARAIERARVARDLHDGVIQSLIALEMQVDALRRQAVSVSSDAAEKLESVRGLLREEVINLRELMQQLQLEDVPPHKLETYLAEMLDKFQRESGIHASFTPDCDVAAVSPNVSREVARIVYEALTNVRKHSGAHSVRVRLQSEDALWKLEIEDDGKGFGFSGRLCQAELDAARKGPQVIKQRVRAIKGELAIESHPSVGARLEIRFSPKGYGEFGRSH